MAYSPRANDTLYIDGAVYIISEHPAAHDMPYGQEGRAATVYRVVGEDTGDLRALKVFKPRYQIPALVSLGERLEAFANIQGLSVCRRQVITARRNIELVRQHPGLSYAVMMPWIEGPTWMETLLEGRELSSQESLSLAHALTEILGGMEERGVAHCDLSGPNVLLPALAANPHSTASAPIELVDVEQMYGEDLKRPEFVPGGSAGYAHKTAADGLWNARADRYAGALLIAEMLGWCDERVRQASWGESYFAPQEMQQEGSERYRILYDALRYRWGEGVAHLLEQSWESDTLADCATFGQWHAAIPDQVPTFVPSVAPVAPATPTKAAEPESPAPVTSPQPQAVQAVAKAHTADALPKYLREMLDEARRCEQNGNLKGALSAYREALSMAPGGSGLAQELPLIIGQLEKAQLSDAGPKKEPLAAPVVAPAAKPAAPPAKQLTVQPTVQTAAETVAMPLAQAQIAQPEARAFREPATTPAFHAQAQPVATQIKQGGSGTKVLVPIILVALLALGAIAFFILQPQSRAPGGDALAPTQTPSVVAVVTSEGEPSVAPTGQAVEPQNLSASEYLTLTGHTDKITGLAFSPDGQTTASASGDNAVKLWSTNSGEELRTLDNGVPVYSIDFSPDGKSIATGLADGAMKVWSVSNGALLYSVNASPASISSIAYSPSGELIAISRVGSVIELLQASDGKKVRDFTGSPEGYVNSLVFSPDGETLFSDSSSEVVTIWNVAVGTAASSVTSPAAVTRVAMSRDGQRVALALANGSVEIHNVPTNTLERTLTGLEGSIRSVAFSPDGGTLAVGAVDTPITLWRIADGAQVQTLTTHYVGVGYLAFSLDGQFLVSGSDDTTVRLWKLTASAAPAATPNTQPSVAPPTPPVTSTQPVNEDPSVFLTLTGHTNTISAMAYSPDGQIIASGSGDGSVRLWRTDTGEERHKLDIGSKVEALAFSPDGKTLATGDGEGAVKVWKVEDATLLFTYDPNPVSCCVSEVAFSPDGALLAINDSALGVNLMQIADGTTFRTFPDGQGGAVSNLLFSPDGQIVYTDANSNILDAWRVGDGAKIELNPAADTIIRVTVLPDNQRIALSLANGSIEIWNIATYEVERTLKLDTDRIRTIAFSPDGKIVATSAYEAIIGLWEVERGTRVGSLARQGLSPAHLAFSPDGQFLASGGEDNRVTLWKVAEGIDK